MKDKTVTKVVAATVFIILCGLFTWGVVTAMTLTASAIIIG
jgi:hypothetical protein